MKAQDFFLISLACFIVTAGQFLIDLLIWDNPSVTDVIYIRMMVTIWAWLIVLTLFAGIAFAICGLIKRYLERRSPPLPRT